MMTVGPQNICSSIDLDIVHNYVTVLNIPFVCDLDDDASMPESLPSDTDAETEQLVDTTELADEPVAEFNIHVDELLRCISR